MQMDNQRQKLCLVCWWWWFAYLIAPAVTTISIILSSSKVQNGDILVPADPGPPGKVAIAQHYHRWSQEFGQRKSEKKNWYRVGKFIPLVKFMTSNALILLVWQQKRHQICKKLRLVCWWWWFAHLIAPAVTTISIILISSKVQNGDILVLANPGPPGKIAIKMERESVRLMYTVIWQK